MLFGIVHKMLYPHFVYIFFGPSLGFWGLCAVLLGIFNLVFFPIYYRSAYQYGVATTLGIMAITVYGVIMEYIGLKNSWVFELFKGAGRANIGLHSMIFLFGLALFSVLTYLGYKWSLHHFKKVEL